MNSKILSGFIWRFAERTGAQLVTFIVSIVLARLLDPQAYGTVALITVFITILQIFVDSGLGNALIQKKDADDIDFSTVFYTNIVFCTVLYLIIYQCAPYISRFYNDLTMIPLIRILSITIIVSGVKNVQQAYVSRNMLFKKFFFSTLGGTICAAIIGIFMALHGMGALALVMQQVINVSIDTIILWITVKWRPKRLFSLKRLKKLYSFGWKLLASSLIDTIYNNIRPLIIGKFYSSSDLAFYNKGKQFPNLIITNINTSIDSILFPAMSQEQDDRNHIRNMTRRSIKISVYVIAPLMMGLAFTAPAIIKLLLTEKWLPCVPFLRIFCITFTFYPIHAANLNAIKALGRSDLFLKLEIEKKIVGLIALLLTMNLGVMPMAYSLLVTSLISQIINSWPNRKLLDYKYIDQLKDILPSIGLALFMGICISSISLFNMPAIIELIFQIILGIFIYLIGSIIFKFDSFQYMYNILKHYLKR